MSLTRLHACVLKHTWWVLPFLAQLEMMQTKFSSQTWKLINQAALQVIDTLQFPAIYFLICDPWETSLVPSNFLESKRKGRSLSKCCVLLLYCQYCDTVKNYAFIGLYRLIIGSRTSQLNPKTEFTINLTLQKSCTSISLFWLNIIMQSYEVPRNSAVANRTVLASN